MPTPSLVIQLLCGPGAGRSAVFTSSPVSFGRDPDNTLIVSESYTSRRHGEFRIENDRWVLANLSENGTKVGRSTVTGKPRVLKGGEEISIADTPVFRVGFDAPPIQPGGEAAQESAAQPAGRKPWVGWSSRSKLWIGLGVWWVVVIGVILLLLVAFGSKQGNTPTGAVELSARDVRDALFAALPPQPADPAKARARINEARDLASAMQGVDAKTFAAYRAYREALLYQGKDSFEDPIEQLKFENIRNQIVENVRERYQTGYSQLKSGRYTDAVSTLSRLANDLYQVYGDARDNALNANVQALLEAAKAGASAKRPGAF